MEKYDIYYADLSPVVGSEQGGVRPCVIVQNNTGNLHSSTTIIVPLTTKIYKPKIPTHVAIRKNIPCPSIILCEQIRTIDKGRLFDKIGTVPRNLRPKLDEALAISLGLR